MTKRPLKAMSVGVVAEITDIGIPTLKSWCDKRIIRAVRPAGKGHGRHRLIPFSQVVALKFAADWRKIGGPDFIRGLILNLSRLTDEELLAAFDEGRTHLLELPGGPLVRGPKKPNPDDPFAFMCDVSRAYQDVKLQALYIESREAAKRGRGRRVKIKA